MPSDEEDLSAEQWQLQAYTVDAKSAQPATGKTFYRNRKINISTTNCTTTHMRNDGLRNMLLKIM